MKLLSMATLALGAATAAARSYNDHIPFDCFQETQKAFGNEEGSRVSDLDLMSGLDPNSHQLISISGCYDPNQQVITGVVSTYGKWKYNEASVDSAKDYREWFAEDAFNTYGSPVLGDWEDVYRMNVVGTLGDLNAFDDNGVLSKIGVPALNDAQSKYFNTLWTEIANPRVEKFYKSKDPKDKSTWQAAMQKLFTASDANRDGMLSRREFYYFMQEARPADGLDTPQDVEDRKVYRAWDAYSSLSQPADKVSFQNFVSGESIMSAWFNGDKMASTGYYYDENKTESAATMAVTCGSIELGRGDRVRHLRVQSSARGVHALEIQTEKRPYDVLGVVQSTATQFVDAMWLRYDLNESMFGFWGFSNAETGALNALGFIQKDEVCWAKFTDAFTTTPMTWNSPIPGTEQTRPTPPSTDFYDKLVASTVPAHDHGEGPQAGLLVACIVIWVLFVLIGGYVLYQRCAKKQTAVTMRA